VAGTTHNGGEDGAGRIIASKAGDEFDWKSVLILSAVLSVGSYLAFIALLKLQMPVWPWFVGN